MGKKGNASILHTDEQKIAIAKAVCDLYESQGCTLQSACESAGISDRLFRYWCASFSEISELYKKAKSKSVEIYWDRLRDKAQTSLERLVEGEKYTETKYETGTTSTGVINKTTETEVTVLPNPTSVIFALKGEFPERFVDRHEVSAKDGKPLVQLNDVPLEAKLAALAILEGGKMQEDGDVAPGQSGQ
jgi:hypothetical protein